MFIDRVGLLGVHKRVSGLSFLWFLASFQVMRRFYLVSDKADGVFILLFQYHQIVSIIQDQLI